MASISRPVIGFLTDFGLDGAAATCRGVMLSICPDAQVVDISHTIPKFSIRDGAFVLRSALPYLPVGVHVGVVDPGVGTDRRPVAIRTERGDVLIGPDNGLLIPAAEALGGVSDARELTNRELWLPRTTATFHGRDLFAPVAAHLAVRDTPYETIGPLATDLVRLPQPQASTGDGTLETAVTYIDSFGNLRLAGGRSELGAAFAGLAEGDQLVVRVGSEQLESCVFVRSFGHAAMGASILYIDSTGDLALADNQASLAARIGARSGDRVEISEAATLPRSVSR